MFVQRPSLDRWCGHRSPARSWWPRPGASLSLSLSLSPVQAALTLPIANSAAFLAVIWRRRRIAALLNGRTDFGLSVDRSMMSNGQTDEWGKIEYSSILSQYFPHSARTATPPGSPSLLSSRWEAGRQGPAMVCKVQAPLSVVRQPLASSFMVARLARWKKRE